MTALENMTVEPNALAADPAHEWLRAVYDRTAQKYRTQDEEHVSGEDYRNVSQELRKISSSFGKEIRALDLGCGTGRYFHCVEKAHQLVGLDISQEMLQAARKPVRAQEVTARDISLVQGDLFSAKFPDGHFDFIYCLGVFGNGCGITKAACAQIWRWLAPGGAWFFDATDTSNLPLPMRLRKQVAAGAYVLLPKALKNLWMKRKGWPPFFGSSINGVRSKLLRTGFTIDWMASRQSQLPGGRGFKLEVLCRKPAA